MVGPSVVRMRDRVKNDGLGDTTHGVRTMGVMLRAASKRYHVPRWWVGAVVGLCVLGGCSSSGSTSTSATTVSTTTASGTTAPPVSAISTVAGLKQAHWAKGVTIEYGTDSFQFISNGIPNHARQAEYAVPNPGVIIPTAATARATADPTSAQQYDYTITTRPAKATTPTEAGLGVIGVMISGAVLFNPYEGDGSTIALKENFTVKDAQGHEVSFLDSCNGHPGPGGQYHYHGLPLCITRVVDGTGPSHLIGVAFDGYPIYGNRDIHGAVITHTELDACNGITSPTPEFPHGIYHYVLLDTPDSSSSIRCFYGTPNISR